MTKVSLEKATNVTIVDSTFPEDLSGSQDRIPKVTETPQATLETREDLVSALVQTPELSLNLMRKLEEKKRGIVSGITVLLENGSIEDEADRRLIVEAIAFIENPTEDLQETMGHTTNIGQVMAGYEMQGMDVPSEIDAMHAYLLALQCINRFDFIEKELDQNSPDLSKVKEGMAQIFNWAGILSAGYKDNAMLDALKQLQGELK